MEEIFYQVMGHSYRNGEKKIDVVPRMQSEIDYFKGLCEKNRICFKCGGLNVKQPGSDTNCMPCNRAEYEASKKK